MKKLLHITVLSALFFINSKSVAQINVTTGQNATQLAQMLVGKGVKISNVSLTTSNNQSGKFFISNNALPFDSGVVLTTGCAKTSGSVRGVNGNNQSGVVSNSLGTAGDADLEWLLNNNTGTPKTRDACVLEFDLVPSGDSINISYLFSSEEYNGFVCSQFNDVFGFFLTGFGIIGRKNLALVPNASSNVPVTINTINDGVPSGGNPLSACQAYPGSPFTGYYQANANGSYLTHYGRTKELIAKAKVTPCKTYHLRLAIGDFSDGAYDSGIFLKAGSIKSEPQAALKLSNTYIDSNKDVLVERCHPRGYVRVERNKKLDTTKALTLNFSFGGTATYGVDYTCPISVTFAPNQTLDSLPIDIIDDGIGDDNEIIWIRMLPPCAGVPVDSIAVKIKEFWSYNSSGIDTLCYPSIKQVKSLFADSLSTTFLWNTGDTSRGISATSSGVYTSLATYKNTCTQKDTFDVTIDSLVVKNTIKNLSTCKLDSVTLSYTVNQPPVSSVWSTGSTDSIIKVGSTGNYIMTCTTKKGCIAKDTSVIKYISNPILTLPPTVNFCNGDSVLLTASTDLGLHYLWSTGDTTNAIWVKNTSSYSVVAQANGCIAFDTTDVISKPNPSVNFPTNIAKCKGDSVLLDATNAAGGIYTWNNGNNGASFWATASGQYIVSVDLNGCFAKDTSNIIFYDVPVLNLPIAKDFCIGDSLILDATTFAGTTYLWSTNETTPSIKVKTAAMYFVKASLGVCDAYDTAIVTVTQYPILNLQATISSCVGDSAKLDVSGAAGTTYSWNTGETSPIIFIKNTGQYIATASLNGCVSKDTTDAIFNKTPILNLPITKDFCAGDSLTLNAITYTGTTYLWSTGETTSSIKIKAAGTYFVKASLGVCDAYDTTIVTVTQYPLLNLQATISSCVGDSAKLDASGIAGTTYSWNTGETSPIIFIKNTRQYIAAANLNGCITKDTTDAIFNKTPILNLPITKDFCAGDSLILNAITYAGTTYLWNTNETTSSIKIKQVGTYFVKASLGVCNAYDTTIVTVTQYPIVNLQTNISGCVGDQILLDATNPIGTKYNWNTGETSPTITISKSGIYIVKADLNGCITKDTAVAILNNTPILNLPVTKDFCEGDSLVLDATTYAGTSYLWNTGETIPTIKIKQAGTYFVKATLGVCNAYDTTVVTVTQYLALHLKRFITSCVGDIVVLDATNNPATTYLWNTNETTAAIKAKTNGQYIVAASLNNCISHDTANVIFYNKPIVTVSSSSVSFCNGDSAIVTATSNIANSQFIWNNVTFDSNITIKIAGEYVVFVKANDCLTTDTVTATVYPLPVVYAGKDFYVLKNETPKLNATAGKDVISYQWSPASNLNSSNILQPTILHPFDVDTTYKLFVYNDHCSNYDFVKVITLPEFTIPNVFTPNGDNKNDLWEIKGIEKYPGISVNIFDRYGRKVFTQSEYKKSWDGTYQGEGKPLEIGTYYYIIDLKNGKPVLSGSVTILR